MSRESIPPYRIQARIKNNRLLRAIRQQWPDCQTQNEAARRLCIDATYLSELLNLRHWPYNTRSQCWHPRAVAVATALCEEPEYLFDGTLYGKPAQPIELEVNRPALEAAGLLALPPASPEARVIERETAQAIHQAIETLPEREVAILQQVFGLNGEEERSLEEIGRQHGMTRERTRQIKEHALRVLRRPHTGLIRHLEARS